MTSATTPQSPEHPSRGRQIAVLALFVAISIAVQIEAASVTEPVIGTWYRGLAKPSWTPPDVAFPIVWTLLYLTMAAAAWQAWRSAPGASGGALFAYFVQLALNLSWTFFFFGLQDILLGLVNILALILAILATIIAFAPLSKLAALLMVPYLLWVLYAASLNAAIVEMNR